MTRPDAAPARPEGAAARLSSELRREVADYEVRIEEALLRGQALRLQGQHDAAARADDEQVVLLSGLEQRLEAQVAAAFVSREAERVVAASALDRVIGLIDTDPVAAPVAPLERSASRLVLSGVASVIAMIATAVLLTANGGGGPLDMTAVRDAIAQAVGRDVTPAPQAADDTDDPTTAAGEQQALGRDGLPIPSSSNSPSSSSTFTPDGSAGPAVPGSLLSGDVGETLQDLTEEALGTLPTDLPLPLPSEPSDDDTEATPTQTPSEDQSGTESESETESPSEDETASDDPNAPAAPAAPAPDAPADDASTEESSDDASPQPSASASDGEGSIFEDGLF